MENKKQKELPLIERLLITNNPGSTKFLEILGLQDKERMLITSAEEYIRKNVYVEGDKSLSPTRFLFMYYEAGLIERDEGYIRLTINGKRFLK